MQTLGEFYKEKVLPRKDLKEIYLPNRRDNIKIDHRLFEWRLYYSPTKYIECKSEYEARYLKVWVEAEVREIQIPKDEEFLKTIVPELERLKKKIDEIIEDGLEKYVLRRRIKQQIISVAWRHITNYKDEEEDKEVKGKKKRKKKSSKG